MRFFCKITQLITLVMEVFYRYAHHFPTRQHEMADAAQFPELCQQTDDDEQGGLRFEIDKSRISIRLTAPYSEERRNVASKLAMETNIFIN